MEISKNLIIFPILLLHLLWMSDGKSCKPMTCSYGGPSINYPFGIKGRKPKSCSPAFDVYCDYKSGKPLLELPSAGNFTIDYMSDYSREIDLSDPDDCLPGKLMAVDINKISPFQPRRESMHFQLYNCSGDYYDYVGYESYDIIHCLSKSGYTIISAQVNASVSDPNCTFLKTVSTPGSSFYSLNYITRIYLTWNGTRCASCDSPNNGLGVVLVFGLVFGSMGVIIVIVFACCKRRERMNRHANNSTSRVTDEVSGLQRQSTAVTTGLDQITIDSYPVVVIGESGRLIKPDDDTCPICLSKYSPHEMLKMLPECLHRFHADCIDEWLRAKAICPICRISPPRS